MAPCNDPASQSNPEEVAATHAKIVMDVDFDAKVIQGSVEYTVEIKVRAHTLIRAIHSYALYTHTRIQPHTFIRALSCPIHSYARTRYNHTRIHPCTHTSRSANEA